MSNWSEAVTRAEAIETAARALLKAIEGERLPFRGEAWGALLTLRNAVNALASPAAAQSLVVDPGTQAGSGGQSPASTAGAQSRKRCPAHGNDEPCVVCEVNRDTVEAAAQPQAPELAYLHPDHRYPGMDDEPRYPPAAAQPRAQCDGETENGLSCDLRAGHSGRCLYNLGHGLPASPQGEGARDVPSEDTYAAGCAMGYKAGRRDGLEEALRCDGCGGPLQTFCDSERCVGGALRALASPSGPPAPRAEEAPAPEPCPGCGGDGEVMCPACHDSGVNSGGENCLDCVHGRPTCKTCRGKGCVPPPVPEEGT